MNKPIRILASVALVATVAAGASACDSYDDSHGKGDAPVAGHTGDDSPANVTNFPDSYGNVATKCLAGAPGLRVISNTAKRFVVVKDAGCK